jgi:hypothetical protein
VKYAVGALYLVVSAYAMNWASHMILRQMNASRFSYWFIDLFLGGLILGVGALLRWTRWQKQTSSLLVLGSGMIAVYYLGAAFVTIRRRYFAGKLMASFPSLAFALIPVLLVLGLWVVAMFEKFRPELLEPPPKTLDSL